jgi:hypothetical protein
VTPIVEKLVEKFREAETRDFPDFHNYKTPLERGLWVLWVSKEKLGIKRLDAEQIASVIREVKETSIDAKSIISAFNRAGDKIHAYYEDGSTLFEVMKTGKDYLMSKGGEGSIELFYFEPNQPFTSKRILSKNILNVLEGELKIVDPYCNVRTLDLLKDIKDRPIKVMTRLENLNDKEQNRLMREIRDFKTENSNVELRDYPYKDLHDRYILSSEYLAILGHGIKDLGRKESFVILLNKKTSENIVGALNENFDRRWKQSQIICY